MCLYFFRANLAKCDKCDYVGANTGALTYHVQIKHMNMSRYECPKCDKFKTQRRIAITRQGFIESFVNFRVNMNLQFDKFFS